MAVFVTLSYRRLGVASGGHIVALKSVMYLISPILAFRNVKLYLHSTSPWSSFYNVKVMSEPHPRSFFLNTIFFLHRNYRFLLRHPNLSLYHTDGQIRQEPAVEVCYISVLPSSERNSFLVSFAPTFSEQMGFLTRGILNQESLGAETHLFIERRRGAYGKVLLAL